MLFRSCSSGEEQRRLLAELEEQNRSNVSLENDSLAETLVAYFDRYGSPNERMRAKYILGRTYYCLGELPRALETYYEAADCADTTASDCDYKVLSRIHAQSAVIYNLQVQPRSQLKELRLAEYYAWKGKDTLQAIECFSEQSDVYEFLKKPDSVITICERSSVFFEKIGRKDRASQMKGRALASLIEKNELRKAKRFFGEYELYSELFIAKDSIYAGHEVYYYFKGLFYVANHQLDSAEYLFRKELREGKDLNNQIAASVGLQRVFEESKNSDSIAKYASMAYKLNDSAYSLSEMQNMQLLQASYNYNHHKYVAHQKESEAKIALLTLILVVLISLFILRLFFKRYHLFKKAALDFRLHNAEITRRFHKMAKSQPLQYPLLQDWRDLRSLVEHEIPTFKMVLYSEENPPISDMDYDICVAIRVKLTPIEISKLKQCSPATITKIRKKLFFTIFGKEGTAEDFDDEISKIGY